MADDNRIYFAQRAAEEMDRALAAEQPAVAASHRELQRRYLERALVGDRQLSASDDDILASR